MVGVQFPAEARNFSLLHIIQTALGTTQFPIQWVLTGVSFPRGKTARHEADHSLPYSAKVKNGGAILALPCMSSERFSQGIS
jgi:hypothetical protein